MGKDKLQNESTLYAFHIPSINAIKVGFGTAGRTRMIQYSRQYALTPIPTSLREWQLPSAVIASAAETACHRALLDAGFDRVTHSVGDRLAQELFSLGAHSYDHALLVVTDATQETINSLNKALAKLKPFSEERALQHKREAERRRATIWEEKEADKARERDRLITAPISEIRRRWPKEVQPFITACNTAQQLSKKFPREQGLLKSLLERRKSDAQRMYEWQYWPEIRTLVPTIFHAARDAKRCCYEIENSFHGYGDLAAAHIGMSLWQPGGHDLPISNTYAIQYPFKNGQAFLEIRLVVQLASGFGGADAEELIQLDTHLKDLVTIASETPAPEIRLDRYWKRL